MVPVDGLALLQLVCKRRFQLSPFRRGLEGLGCEEAWIKLSIDGETNDPAVWLLVRGDDWCFGNPWLERGEALGLSNVEDDANIVCAEGWEEEGRVDIRTRIPGKKHWLFTSKQR